MGQISNKISELKLKKGEVVDLRFTDLFGTWQHMTVPIEEIREENIDTDKGFGFDGSSIRG